MSKPVRPKTYDRPGYRSSERYYRDYARCLDYEAKAEEARYQREIEL